MEHDRLVGPANFSWTNHYRSTGLGTTAGERRLQAAGGRRFKLTCQTARRGDSLHSAGSPTIDVMSSAAYKTDTSPEALAVQLECLRSMTPQQRIRQTCAVSRQVRRMAFDAIRRRHPELDEDEVQLRFIELTYGTTLATEVRFWKAESRR